MDSYNVLLIVGGALLFAISVGTPVIKLNTSVVKLLSAVGALEKVVDGLVIDNRVAHARIWERVDEQGDQISNHESRINLLEHSS